MLSGRSRGAITISTSAIPSGAVASIHAFGVQACKFHRNQTFLRTGQLTHADGEPVVKNGTQNFKGCRDSEFDQYGDVEAFGLYPEVWQQ